MNNDLNLKWVNGFILQILIFPSFRSYLFLKIQTKKQFPNKDIARNSKFKTRFTQCSFFLLLYCKKNTGLCSIEIL